MTTNEPGLWWIAPIFLGYAILVVGGYWPLGPGAGEVALLAALAVVALAAADAILDLGRVYRIELNLGLFLLLPGQSPMIAAAFFGVVIHRIVEFLSPRTAALAVASPDSPEPAAD